MKCPEIFNILKQGQQFFRWISFHNFTVIIYLDAIGRTDNTCSSNDIAVIDEWPDHIDQGILFKDSVEEVRSARLMAAVDAVNRQYGREMLRSAASGTSQPWAMRSDSRSPRYTTRWSELPVAR